LPRRRGFSQARLTTSQKRRVGWEEGPGGTGTTAVSATGSSIMGSGASILFDGNTVARTRGYIANILTTATNAGDGFEWGYGICVVSGDAFGVGITAVPKPIDDMDWNGWLWHQLGGVFAPVVATIGGVNAVQQIVIDSKAMRKVGINDVLTLIGQFVEVGTATLEIHADTRMLFKLP